MKYSPFRTSCVAFESVGSAVWERLLLCNV